VAKTSARALAADLRLPKRAADPPPHLGRKLAHIILLLPARRTGLGWSAAVRLHHSIEASQVCSVRHSFQLARHGGERFAS